MSAEIRKQRLRRLDLVFVRSPIYFVTACLENCRKLLATPAIHETFLRFGKQGPLHGAWVGAYVIMPDHLHVFVATDDEKNSDLRLDEIFEERHFEKPTCKWSCSTALAEDILRSPASQ